MSMIDAGKKKAAELASNSERRHVATLSGRRPNRLKTPAFGDWLPASQVSAYAGC
jgi:hypothetical protein